MTPGRPTVLAWMALCVAAARAHGCDIVDGVYNDLNDPVGLKAECEQGRDMGFDGKTLIHPNQIDICNATFAPAAAEIESALVAHAHVAEAAVVGFPHDIKGQGIYVYVTLIAGVEPSEPLRRELRDWVRKEISAIATPDVIQWAPSLPKTRSGKIMRRILRKIAAHESDQLGDISTLADPGVVKQLIEEHGRSTGSK